MQMWNVKVFSQVKIYCKITARGLASIPLSIHMSRFCEAFAIVLIIWIKHSQKLQTDGRNSLNGFESEEEEGGG